VLNVSSTSLDCTCVLLSILGNGTSHDRMSHKGGVTGGGVEGFVSERLNVGALDCDGLFWPRMSTQYY
jgi:hypothetical protein